MIINCVTCERELVHGQRGYCTDVCRQRHHATRRQRKRLTDPATPTTNEETR